MSFDYVNDDQTGKDGRKGFFLVMVTRFQIPNRHTVLPAINKYRTLADERTVYCVILICSTCS